MRLLKFSVLARLPLTLPCHLLAPQLNNYLDELPVPSQIATAGGRSVDAALAHAYQNVRDFLVKGFAMQVSAARGRAEQGFFSCDRSFATAADTEKHSSCQRNTYALT